MSLQRRTRLAPRSPLFLLLALVAATPACSGARTEALTAAQDAADAGADAAVVAVEVHEHIVPHTCSSRAKIEQILGRNAPQAPSEDAIAKAAPPPPAPSAKDTSAPGPEVYRKVAPATVLVRTRNGFGSGVVVDPKGYVLTNHHVIADGEKKDFIVHVQVAFGDLTATGRMSLQTKTYDGVVVKTDPVRDLALVRVMNPPAKLAAVTPAKSAPQVGEGVVAIGNAGIGFLWAVKSCHVAGVGEHQQDRSILAGIDCAHTDPTMSSDEAQAQRKNCEEHKKRTQDSFNAYPQGLAVQTDCAMTHGDSGGPLVNQAGDLVGVNESMAVDGTTASFHVHVDEVRDFLSKHGEEGIAILPDPLCDGGMDASLEDVDLDGIPETLVLKNGWSYRHQTVLIDLDQDHFTKERGPLEPFDTEIAALTDGEATYIWYDVDNDSHFDVLLVDEKSRGKPDHAYRLLPDGGIKEARSLLPAHDFDVSLVKDPALHARLGKIALALGRSQMTSPEALAAAATSMALPDPLLGAGSKGRLVDADGNGRPDTVFVRSAFAHGMLLDTNERSIGGMKVGDPADDAVKAKKVEAQLALVVQGDSAWAFYDTDNDSKFDLALMAEGKTGNGLYATRAWHLGADGALSPAPEQLGRKLLRAGLLSSPRALSSLQAARRQLDYTYALDEGASALPDPLTKGYSVRYREVKGFPKGTVFTSTGDASGGEGGSATTTWFDLKRRVPVPDKTSIEKVVGDAKFQPTVSVITRGDWTWVYYDTDGDGLFDLVLFASKTGQDPVQAYRLKHPPAKEKGMVSITVDPAAVHGRLIRHKSVFKDKALAARWNTLAAQIFRSTSIEE
jgi:S1-C subfamily serine protease